MPGGPGSEPEGEPTGARPDTDTDTAAVVPEAAPVARRRHRRWPWITLATLVALALLLGGGGAVYVDWTVHRSLPTLDGRLDVPGLEHPVNVLRDGSGIPQIYAEDPHDLFLAEGYVQAQDRFWQMDVQRHITAGRLAELFGAGQVDKDKVVRTLGWYRVAEQEVERAAPQTRANLTAFADGVNAYLGQRQGSELSVEYAILDFVNSGYQPAPWTPADSVSWLKAVAWQLNSTTNYQISRAVLSAKLPAADVDRLYPPYDFTRWDPITGPATAVSTPSPSTPSPSAPAAVPAGAGSAVAGLTEVSAELTRVLGPTGTGIGSNSWVVSGSRTTTGTPMLANDPHLAPSLPGTWYQVGLHCRTPGPSCPYDVSGFTFPGMPGVVIGHNSRIAWGFTALGTADSDLYLEKVQGSQYEYQGQQLPLETHTETIDVADGRPVTLTVRATRHGPLISDVLDTARQAGEQGREPGVPPADGGYAVALRWVALDPGPTIDALFEMDTATDWTSFRAATAHFTAPAQNIVYADVDGNIGYQMPGLVPVRQAGDGSLPVPGWTGDHEWTGFVPTDRLPSSFNPPQGYIVTANNAVVGPDYPYPISPDWGPGYRSQRITDLIARGGKLDAAAMQKIGLDTRNPNAAELTPYLLDAPVAKETSAARDLLRGWDCTQPADSAPAAYFNAVWSHLLDLVFASRLRPVGDPQAYAPGGGGRWFDVVRTMLRNPDDPWWSSPDRPGPHGRDAVLATAMDEAAADLSGRLGENPQHWRWGALHTLTLTNQTLGTGGPGPVKWLLNRGPYEVGGGTDLVDATGWFPLDGYQVDWAPSMRMVVDLGHLDDSRWINLTGESGHTASANYTDQTALWLKGDTLAWPFTGKAVEAAATHHLTLGPPGAR